MANECDTEFEFAKTLLNERMVMSVSAYERQESKDKRAYETVLNRCGKATKDRKKKKDLCPR